MSSETGICKRKIVDVKKELSLPRKELGGKSLILIEKRKTEQGDSDTDLITIVDIWLDNFNLFLGVVHNMHHPSELKEGGVVHDMHQGGAPHAPKEDLFKEDHFDDDVLNAHTREGCGNVDNSAVLKKNPKGEEVVCSKDEYFKYCIATRKPWTTDEIKEAWCKFTSQSVAISDFKLYLDQIIQNKRDNEETCKKPKIEKKELRKELETLRSEISEIALKEPVCPKVTVPFTRNPGWNPLNDGRKRKQAFWSW